MSSVKISFRYGEVSLGPERSKIAVDDTHRRHDTYLFTMGDRPIRAREERGRSPPVGRLDRARHRPSLRYTASRTLSG